MSKSNGTSNDQTNINPITPSTALKAFEGIIKGWVGNILRPNVKVGNQYVTDVPVAHNFSQWDSLKKENVTKTIWITVKLWSRTPIPKKTMDMLTGKSGYITARGPIETREWISKKTGQPGYTVELIATQKHIEVREGGSTFSNPIAEDVAPEQICA